MPVPLRKDAREVQPREGQDEPPPFLGEWRRLYWGLVLYLAVLIVSLYGLTVYFRPPL